MAENNQNPGVDAPPPLAFSQTSGFSDALHADLAIAIAKLEVAMGQFVVASGQLTARLSGASDDIGELTDAVRDLTDSMEGDLGG